MPGLVTKALPSALVRKVWLAKCERGFLYCIRPGVLGTGIHAAFLEYQEYDIIECHGLHPFISPAARTWSSRMARVRTSVAERPFEFPEREAPHETIGSGDLRDLSFPRLGRSAGPRRREKAIG